MSSTIVSKLRDGRPRQFSVMCQKPMLELVPRARAGWEVRHMNAQAEVTRRAADVSLRLTEQGHLTDNDDGRPD
jgi:hypothetical protein